MMRSSRADPLHVDWVRCLAGWIGMTACPGRKADGFGPRCDRDLAADLVEIAGTGSTMLVTLIEQYEFAMLGLSGFPDAVDRAGLHWLHLPICDISIPDVEFERAWMTAGQQLHQRLGRGERIVVHCRAGLGRTGLIAARLLVEAGATPDEAIRIVRAARPGTIETDEQLDFLRDLGG